LRTNIWLRSGYDGFFFDTLGFEQLPAAAQQAFARRHPGADYNRCQGQFLAALRRRMPAGTLIFTNQGYRHAAEFLPHADLDLTESYFTFLSGSRTRMRPWEAIRTPMVELVLAAQRQFPDVRFVHVNYAAAPAEGAAVYSYAAAKLFGHESYLIVPGDSASEEHDVYSADLGKPLTAGYEEDAAAGAVWRRYEFGAVAIHAGARPFVIPGTRYTLTAPGRGYVFRQGLSGGL
jgi:hypothetical protein